MLRTQRRTVTVDESGVGDAILKRPLQLPCSAFAAVLAKAVPTGPTASAGPDGAGTTEGIPHATTEIHA